jgi:hypothetical protein
MATAPKFYTVASGGDEPNYLGDISKHLREGWCLYGEPNYTAGWPRQALIRRDTPVVYGIRNIFTKNAEYKIVKVYYNQLGRLPYTPRKNWEEGIAEVNQLLSEGWFLYGGLIAKPDDIMTHFQVVVRGFPNNENESQWISRSAAADATALPLEAAVAVPEPDQKAAAAVQWIRRIIGGQNYYWNPSNNHLYFCEADGSMGKWAGIYEPKLGKINSSIKEPSLEVNENLNPLPARSGLDAIRYLHEDTNVEKLKPKKDISKSVNNWNKIISTKLENMKTSGWTNPKTGKPPTRMNAIVETSKWKLENYEGGSRKQKATRKRSKRSRKTRRS